MKTAFIYIKDLHETYEIDGIYLVQEASFPNLQLINQEDDSVYFRLDYDDEDDIKDALSTLVFLLIELKIIWLEIKIDDSQA